MDSDETMKQFVLTKIKNRDTGFLFEDGKPMEIRCYDEKSMLGNIYVGRVSNLVKNINAAFVDIQKGESAYLSLEDYKGAPLKIGDLLVVQVIREKMKTKRLAVTASISMQGEYAVVGLQTTCGVSAKITEKNRRNELKTLLQDTLSEAVLRSDAQAELHSFLGGMLSFGGIVRTQAEMADKETIVQEIETLTASLLAILKQAVYAPQYTCLYQNEAEYIVDAKYFLMQGDVEILTDIPDITEALPTVKLYEDSYSLALRFSLETVLEKALNKRAYLKSGGYLVIEPTEAMIVIDVNSGKSIKGKQAEEQFFKINMEAAKEIARQLRLRNLSGIILIDFISMKEEEHNRALLQSLAGFAATDPVRVNVVDMTRLGLVEITRQKCKKPLYEVFAE